MSKGKRETIADWLMLGGAPLLFGSLLLTWSHQFSRGFLIRYGASPALHGVPHDPNAWQLYSGADVLLAAVAAALLAVALRGGRHARLALVPALAVAIAFTLHALSAPASNGADIFDPALGRYAADARTAGPGVTLALIGLGLGLAGTLLAFTAD